MIHTRRQATRRERFQQARSFVIYYGSGHANKLARYDIAVVEPTAFSSDEIEFLKENGTLVLAYVTVMELGPFHDMYSLLKDEDFLKIEGDRYHKKQFNTDVLDLKSKRWKGLLIHHVGRLLLQQGYDGLFLDTIGDVEDPLIPLVESRVQTLQAAEIVKTMRNTFANHLIVQNNGLERLCLETGPFIDGICWENPLFAHPGSADWCALVLKNIIGLKDEFGVRALFLHEANEVKERPSSGITAQTIADRHDFLYYEAPDYYLALPAE